jgi:hypothetical protein
MFLAGLLVPGAEPARADTITVDEHGGFSGTGVYSSFLLFGTENYNLTFVPSFGEVHIKDGTLETDRVLFESVQGSTVILGRLIFGSLSDDGQDAPGDASSLPSFGGTFPEVTVNETGTETNNSATYTPAPGDPGYDVSGPTYVFISDGTVSSSSAVPEPTTLTLCGIAFASLLGYAWRRRRNLALA